MTTKKQTQKKDQFEFRTIKSFEDACVKVGIDADQLPNLAAVPGEYHKPIIAHFKLIIIFKAINNGWKPDWGNENQHKYFPWFWLLSSGFGFGVSCYYYTFAIAGAGSRLCTDTGDKAIYIAKQFEDLYRDFLLYSE